MACSGVGLETFALPGGADLLRLPEIDRLGDGAHVGLASLRAALLAAAVERFRPHVLVVDQHPLADHDELWPTLRLLRDQGGLAALDLDLGGSRRAAALLLELAGRPGRPGRPRQPAPELIRLASGG